MLDRPNPVNGVDVAGPVLESGSESFVGMQRIPIRHGMTVGELAVMFASERKLKRRPVIVKCKHWDRRLYFDQLSLPWVNPSPNIRNLNQATIYPGLGMLETTNISVGRGTDSPFERLGAPWIDGVGLAKELNKSSHGVSFTPIEFKPESSKYAGQLCSGVQLTITNREQYDPVESGIRIALALRKLHRDQWNTGHLNRLISNRAVVQMIETQKPYADIEAAYQREMEAFLKQRKQYLFYPEPGFRKSK